MIIPILYVLKYKLYFLLLIFANIMHLHIVFVGCMVDEGFISFFFFTNIQFFLLSNFCYLLVVFCWFFVVLLVLVLALPLLMFETIPSIFLLVATFRGRGLIDFIDENQQQWQNCSFFDDI